jgi:predicted transcriptional regulator
MARTQTLVQLSSELVAQLDREAALRGCSRSALIREAVIAHLSQSAEREAVRRYVEGYRRMPQGDVDEWGETGAELDHAAAETMRRLDAEDRAAGRTW